MSGELYSRSALSPFTRADSAQVNSELIKIQAAIETLRGNINDIVAGTPIASYTWTAFANSADGTDSFTTGDPDGRLYIGIAYNRGSPTESTDPTDYTWTRLRGEDGEDAGSGSDGLSIVEKFVYKRAASAPATPAGGSFNFSTQATTAPSGWSTGVPGGTDPVWVSVAVAAKQGTGGTANFGTWSAPALAFLNGTDGADGVDGTPGSSVDIIFKRSATQPSTPAAGLSTPSGWYTNVAAVPAGPDPIWSSVGTRPDPSSNWTWNVPVQVQGINGVDGTNGLNNAVILLYRRASSSPTMPSGTFTYTFATGALSGGSLNGWTQGIPAADGNPLWVTGATASSGSTTDSIPAAEFSAAVIKDGAGLNAATVFLYQRAASAPSVPGSTLTYTFATGVVSGTLGSWSQSVPANNGNPVYIITATALSTGTTDTIATGEWSTPQVLAANGSDGATGPAGPTGPTGPTGPSGPAGSNGSNGTNGSNGLSIAATLPIITVARSFSGSVKSFELPKTTQLKVYDGFTDVTASCTFSRTVHNCSVSNDGGGAFTMTAVSDYDAYVDLTATYGSRSITMRVVTSQPRDGSAASRVSANLSTMTTSGSFVSVGSVDIVVANGSTVNASGSTTYQATNTGSGTRYVRAEGKVSIQNLTDGGAESDGSSVIGSAASYIAGDGPSDIGSVSAGHSVTNSTGAPKTFRIKFYVRKYDGLANINTTGGTYAGTVAAEAA